MSPTLKCQNSQMEIKTGRKDEENDQFVWS